MTEVTEPVPTPRYREIVATASRFAADLGHRHVGTEHLFLAIIADRDAVPTQVLGHLVDLTQAESELRAVMESHEYKTPTPRVHPPNAPLSPSFPGTGQVLVAPGHRPPVHELPAVLATPELAGRADHIALAIPSLLVYSTGIELQILCRYREGRVEIDKTEDRQAAAVQANESFRETADRIPRLITVNAKPVELLGGQGDRYGFTYRAWARFRPEAAYADLVLSLSWPGLPAVEHRVAAAVITDAVQRVVALWPEG